MSLWVSVGGGGKVVRVVVRRGAVETKPAGTRVALEEAAAKQDTHA